MRWLHELYTIADPACTTRVTVPTLWDAKTRRIVNNESSEMIRMFNTAFAGLAERSPDYYPEPLRPEIDAANALVLKGHQQRCQWLRLLDLARGLRRFG